MARKRIVLPDGSTAMVSDDVEGLDLSPILTPSSPQSEIPAQIPSLVEIELFLHLDKTTVLLDGVFQGIEVSQTNDPIQGSVKSLDLILSFHPSQRDDIRSKVWSIGMAHIKYVVYLTSLKVGPSAIDETFKESTIRLTNISTDKSDFVRLKFQF